MIHVYILDARAHTHTHTVTHTHSHAHTCTVISIDMRMVMRCVYDKVLVSSGDGMDPPLWSFIVNKLSLSLSL